ncbi:MAG TPA: hypothetical protein VHQ47_16780 [Phycisphaerae bacterium]|nr:hypothetical protein [Phycisphaerae bacterium]
MNLAEKLAAVCLGATLFLGTVGCQSTHDTMRPDMDKIEPGEHGLQSADLRQMTSKMAPDLLQIPEIVNNPYRITVVVKGAQNKTEDMPGRNMDIFVARLAGLLNSSQARDRIQFVEERATLENFQQQELGSNAPNFEDQSRTGQPAPSTRIPPQYALYATIRSMDNGKTTYYLCQFQLTDLRTGAIDWQNQYETRTLNAD